MFDKFHEKTIWICTLQIYNLSAYIFYFQEIGLCNECGVIFKI